MRYFALVLPLLLSCSIKNTKLDPSNNIAVPITHTSRNTPALPSLASYKKSNIILSRSPASNLPKKQLHSRSFFRIPYYGYARVTPAEERANVSRYTNLTTLDIKAQKVSDGYCYKCEIAELIEKYHLNVVLSMQDLFLNPNANDDHTLRSNWRNILSKFLSDNGDYINSESHIIALYMIDEIDLRCFHDDWQACLDNMLTVYLETTQNLPNKELAVSWGNFHFLYDTNKLIEYFMTHFPVKWVGVHAYGVPSPYYDTGYDDKGQPRLRTFIKYVKKLMAPDQKFALIGDSFWSPCVQGALNSQGKEKIPFCEMSNVVNEDYEIAKEESASALFWFQWDYLDECSFSITAKGFDDASRLYSCKESPRYTQESIGLETLGRK